MKIKRKSALISLYAIHSYYNVSNLQEDSPASLDSIDDLPSSDEEYEESIEDKEESFDDLSKKISLDIDEADGDCLLKETMPNFIKTPIKNSIKGIETAALQLRAKYHSIDSGLSLLQHHFNNNFAHFNEISESVYWADKILINFEDQSNKLSSLNEGFFPSKEFMIDISKTAKKIKVLGSLSNVSVALPSHSPMKHALLPPLSSILVPNPVVEQHGSFVNVGSYVKSMSWAPIHPQLHYDQFLAISVFKNLTERCKVYDDGTSTEEMIQIYNCGQLHMSTKEAAPARIEMVLTHNWGKVNHICWSPQPLPAVCRSQKLIGHLAMCCSDGFIRIVPIAKLRNPGCLVTFSTNLPIICLGSIRSKEGKNVFPITMHWRPQFPDRIIAGYNNGNVAVYVLESSVFASRSKFIENNIYLKPSIVRRVFNGPFRSLQISPYNWRLVLCSSSVTQNTVIVDFEQPMEQTYPKSIDTEGTVGSRLIWPSPGDFAVLANGKHIRNNPGLLLCQVQTPPKNPRKLIIPEISSIDLCQSLNIVPIGTHNGELNIFSLNTNQVNYLLRARPPRQGHNGDVMKSKFYYRYCLVANDIGEPTTAVVKTEVRPPVSACNCPPGLQCVHKLISKFSISIDKSPSTSSHDWQLDSMLNINEIASNPNPKSCTWIAVSLECGLVHLVPLTHFYRSEFDEISTGSSCHTLKYAANQLQEESLLPKDLFYFSKHGRPRKSQASKKVKSLKLESKSVACTQNESIVEGPTCDTLSLKTVTRNKSTFITDYFARSSQQSEEKEKPKAKTKKTPKISFSTPKEVKSKKTTANVATSSNTIKSLFTTKMSPIEKSSNISKATKSRDISNVQEQSPISETKRKLRSYDSMKSPSEASFTSPIVTKSVSIVLQPLNVKSFTKRLRSHSSEDSDLKNINLSINERSVTRSGKIFTDNDPAKKSPRKQMNSTQINETEVDKKQNIGNNSTQLSSSLSVTRSKTNISEPESVVELTPMRKILRSYISDRSESIGTDSINVTNDSVIRTRTSSRSSQVIIDASMQSPISPPAKKRARLMSMCSTSNNDRSIKIHHSPVTPIISPNSIKLKKDKLYQTSKESFKSVVGDVSSISSHSPSFNNDLYTDDDDKSIGNPIEICHDKPIIDESVNHPKHMHNDSSVLRLNVSRGHSQQIPIVTFKRYLNTDIDCDDDEMQFVPVSSFIANKPNKTPTQSVSCFVEEGQDFVVSSINQSSSVPLSQSTSIVAPSKSIPIKKTKSKSKLKPISSCVTTDSIDLIDRNQSQSMLFQPDKDPGSIVSSIDQSINEPLSQSTSNKSISIKKTKSSSKPKPKTKSNQQKKQQPSVIDRTKLDKLQSIFSQKRRELLESQSNQSISYTEAPSTSSAISTCVKRNWWGVSTDTTETNTVDIDMMDIDKIDDISLGASSSSKKKHSANSFTDNRMDKIKKVINRGLSQSLIDFGNDAVMDDFPELLQPFRPLKGGPKAQSNNS